MLAAAVVSGCGRSDGPLTAGGQPVSYWLADLNKPDPRSRKKAVKELGHVGAAHPAAIPAVIGALKDHDATVRMEAVVALLNLGRAGKQAEPQLADMSKSDPDKRVREYAVKAVERIEGKRQ
ncbi:MAG: HEAT repeat domain-containing protein [Gemmataceae bacterium]